MNKIIKYGSDAQEAVIKGVDTVANIVKTTVGPKGRNVLIRSNLDAPIITNDGVTIAKSIQIKDNAEDAGAQLIISAANKTNDIAGDGTTTTTILAQEMIKRYYRLSEDTRKSLNVVQVQSEMVKASNEVSDYLLSIAKKVSDKNDVERVATISSGSAETGKILADAFEQAGEFGSVIVEDSKTGKNELVSVQGMKLTGGSVSQYILNDRANMKSEVIDAKLLVMKDKIDSVTELMPVLDICIQTGTKLVIMCDDIEYEPLNLIIYNKAKGAPLNVSIIRLPGMGQLREELLEDICIATGATLIGRDVGITLKDFDVSHLGVLEQAIITMEDSILKFADVNSETNVDLKSARENRVEELKNILEKCAKSDEIEKYKRRISNLASGISVIKVGGNSDIEIKDKKLRLEDAINSVQSAKEEGIVPGGGYSFLSAIMNVAKQKRSGSIGEQIVYDSLAAVTRQIAENAGFDGDMVVAECYNKELGFNALTGNYENLLDTGVINSAKVDRYSVINSASVASTVITMGGMIIEENEPDHNVLQLQAPMSKLL